MATTVLTMEDLEDFKTELLKEIKMLFQSNATEKQKSWLKSFEVRKMLGISPGTLQTLRINGTLPYTKMGGVLYFDNDEIQRILVSNRIHNASHL